MKVKLEDMIEAGEYKAYRVIADNVIYNNPEKILPDCNKKGLFMEKHGKQLRVTEIQYRDAATGGIISRTWEQYLKLEEPQVLGKRELYFKIK